MLFDKCYAGSYGGAIYWHFYADSADKDDTTTTRILSSIFINNSDGRDYGDICAGNYPTSLKTFHKYSFKIGGQNNSQTSNVYYPLLRHGQTLYLNPNWEDKKDPTTNKELTSAEETSSTKARLYSGCQSIENACKSLSYVINNMISSDDNNKDKCIIIYNIFYSI